MGKHNWNENLTIKMIKEYEKRVYLWDPISEDYKNSEMRQQGYKEIINALEVDITIQALKNKIQYIRTAYADNLVRFDCPFFENYEPSVTWFKHADRFLWMILKPKQDQRILVSANSDDELEAEKRRVRRILRKRRREARRSRSSSPPTPPLYRYRI